VIEKHRRDAGMTQAELAVRVGVSQGAVSQWESGVALPEVKHLVKMSSIFGCSVDELIKKEAT
jgi:transcriptional regulator with XRE-family HTH domain